MPALYMALKAAGHQVKVVATSASLYFFDPAALDPVDATRPKRNPLVVALDEDEWPDRDTGGHYRRDDPVLHIELRRWAEVLVVAPLDANTLAKLANGLADNCLTCVWRAWDPARPVVLAPAMNTLMWDHPLTGRHLRQIGGEDAPAGLDRDAIIAWINRSGRGIRIVPPQSKRLACGDVGMGALAELAEIVHAVSDLPLGGSGGEPDV
jgi:phosphopantothenoylcysteine decarboxylase